MGLKPFSLNGQNQVGLEGEFSITHLVQDCGRRRKLQLFALLVNFIQYFYEEGSKFITKWITGLVVLQKINMISSIFFVLSHSLSTCFKMPLWCHPVSSQLSKYYCSYERISISCKYCLFLYIFLGNGMMHLIFLYLVLKNAFNFFSSLFSVYELKIVER